MGGGGHWGGDSACDDSCGGSECCAYILYASRAEDITIYLACTTTSFSRMNLFPKEIAATTIFFLFPKLIIHNASSKELIVHRSRTQTHKVWMGHPNQERFLEYYPDAITAEMAALDSSASV
jgi:hypothetical protein